MKKAVVALIVVLLLCCCCCSSMVGFFYFFGYMKDADGACVFTGQYYTGTECGYILN